MSLARLARYSAVALVTWLSMGTPQGNAVAEEALVKFPAKIDGNCRRGSAKLYDQCGSQMQLFEKALDEANGSGKTLLISYGAEWCIWCHVFASYIAGDHGEMSFRYSDRDKEEYREYLPEQDESVASAFTAQALTRFVRENFVVLHVEGQFSADGRAVLAETGALDFWQNWIPFVFTVTSSGTIAAALDYQNVQKSRTSGGSYPGYYRLKLMTELGSLRDAAK